MKSYKARGIVLHTLRYGDNSLIVYILTDVLGRQTYMVRNSASKGGRTRAAALFQPMFAVEFEGLESPRAQMHRMKDVECALPMHSIPFDIRKSTISLFMAEVLYRLIREVEPNEELFDFLYDSVAHLEDMQQGVANFHLWFLVRLSRFLGFYPAGDYTAGAWFDMQEGHFSSAQPLHAAVINPSGAELLWRLMECEAERLCDIRLSRSDRTAFLDDILSYFGYHLDAMHTIRSVDILREVF